MQVSLVSNAIVWKLQAYRNYCYY